LRFPRSSSDLPEEAMTYADRDQLYRSAVEALGQEEADTLMSSLPPMDWDEIVTKSYLNDRFEMFEHRISAHVDRALRAQTQWVVGALGGMALSMLGVVITLSVTLA
jgi:hypothetical protein